MITFQIANIIFLDAPVGTGFSYATTSDGYHSSDVKTVEDIYTFLQKVTHDYMNISMIFCD